MSLRIFVNLLDGQAPDRLPPEALPLRLPNAEPELREWQAIEHVYRQGLFRDSEFTGLLSPKFPLKTGVAFDEAVAFVRANPGYDAYLFDHGPQYRYYNFNIFEFTENLTPGILGKFAECLALVGETADIASLGRSLPENSVHSNSWIGNAIFWTEMVGRAVAILDAVRASPAARRSLREPVIVNGTVYPFLPCVVERYVPYWLMTRPDCRAKAWPHDKAAVLARCVRPLERHFVEGFHDLFNQWDAAGAWSPDRERFIRDISRAFHRQLWSANDHLVYPWTGERIQPVK
jgi:hypothetical protein